MKQQFHALVAAITFFTRLPLWKVFTVPAEAYARIIPFWPLTGWITGAVTALAFWGLSALLPLSIALILAFGIRILLTGGLHEDGLADFFDGFGGGRTREDVLRIMKDSHLGTYALLGVLFYYLLLFHLLPLLETANIVKVLLVADPLSKMLASLLTNTLPYARTVDQSKAKTLFARMPLLALLFLFATGLAPLLYFFPLQSVYIVLLPLAGFALIWLFVKRKLGAYTGDICGATALLCELISYFSFYFVLK